ncbi:hypothetical protein KUTeg_012867 [Tegillarca granosa]|uniref:Uncharacterized protein n=1 Tax=Tegillarca granosa TaxID=220873 RepID=A0ABQ9EXJ8_TEGGR|nr:hypothetical protein KUTeg_012867 [Tegillarca granosa]
MDERTTNFVENAIFPLSTDSNHSGKNKPLFPSSALCDTVNASHSDSIQNVPNWLENKSFDPALSSELPHVDNEKDNQPNKNKSIVRIDVTDEDTKSEDSIDKKPKDNFVQYCHFLKQCGYMERAVATFQAMIEFNLFCPHKLHDLSLEDKIAVFESFWDSGVSRIGENGAKGWSYWIDNKDSSDSEEIVHKSDSLDEKEQEIISKQQDKWKTWLDIEQLRESSHLLPWRPDLSKNETEEDCEDMDRLVLFDDVSSAVKFEQMERAKGVLYRALQQCPWSKALYLDGVALFGEEKLQEMVDLMMEKEIRVQIPVEEVDILTDVSDTK